MAQIISKSDFVGRVKISPNLEAEFLGPAIIEFHEIDLPAILGDTFYTDFQKKYDDSLLETPVPLTEDYQKLLTALKPYAVYCAFARFLNSPSALATNTGLVWKEHEDSKNIDGETLALLIASANNNAVIHRLKVLSLLNNNSDLYPLWKKDCKPSGFGRTSALGRYDETDYMKTQEY